MMKTVDWTVKILCLGLSLFILYTAAVGQFPVMIQRGIPLVVISVLIFIIFPLKFGKNKSKKRKERKQYLSEKIIDMVFLISSVLSIGYVIYFNEEIALRMGITTTPDIIFSIMGTICILEATRRTTGWALTLVALVAIVYVFVGPYLPGIFSHQGFGLDQFARTMWLSQEGIFGLAYGVMVSFIFMFIIFASFLQSSGAGKAIIDVATALTGKLKGGPALSAVVGSALFGSVSGSATANVLGTGSFTIPLMIKTGFKRRYAGAVEAVASCGGQITPPIMGASAFIMAELTGISYFEIATTAIIPAFLFFLSVFLVIYLRAHRMDLEIVPQSEPLSLIMKKGSLLFIPIMVIFFTLYLGYTPARAGLYGILTILVIGLVYKSSRLNLRAIANTLIDGAKKSLGLAVACASMGIVVGVMSLTGLGVRISVLITDIASDSLFIALFLTMVASIILGMGLPPVAAYVLLVIILGPALANLGLPLLAAHMFVFYFGAFAPISPPVALNAYAASGISGADPFKTGLTALRIGIVGFVVPYMFVYNPTLLLMGNGYEVILGFITAIIGIAAFSIGMEGYLFKNVPIIIRAIAIVSGFLLINFGLTSDIIGLLLFLGVIGYQLVKRSNFNNKIYSTGS